MIRVRSQPLFDWVRTLIQPNWIIFRQQQAAGAVKVTMTARLPFLVVLLLLILTVVSPARVWGVLLSGLIFLLLGSLFLIVGGFLFTRFVAQQPIEGTPHAES